MKYKYDEVCRYIHTFQNALLKGRGDPLPLSCKALFKTMNVHCINIVYGLLLVLLTRGSYKVSKYRTQPL